MEKYEDFAYALQSFFQDYLVKECGVSGNTIRSYRDTFVHFLDYMQSVQKTRPEKITMDKLDRELILSFPNWLQLELGNSNCTRNQRYAALRSFFKYMISIDPLHISQWKGICGIKFKKDVQKTVEYLTVEGIKCILEQINTKTKRGRRDLTMLSLLYNSGARVQELIDSTPMSVRTTKPYFVELSGKGSKKRVVPLDEPMMNLLTAYMDENGLNKSGMDHHPLFFNSRGEKLTNPGITYILKKYADEAKKLNPDLIPKVLSPHRLRHSRAMHLLQAGVNLIYIRDILGHVSVQTTEIYARADSKAKQDALEMAYAEVGIKEPEIKTWEKDPKLKTYLKSLS